MCPSSAPVSSARERQTAAEILAVAVSDLCPDAIPIEGRGTRAGFAYRFRCPTPLSEEMLPDIEYRMHEIIESDLPIEHMEMTPENAGRFVRHLGHHRLAGPLLRVDGPLVDLFRMGSFVDVCPAPYLPSTGGVGRVKLSTLSARTTPLSGRGRGGSVTRIEGLLYGKGGEEKAFLKRGRALMISEHRTFGEKEGFFVLRPEKGREGEEREHLLWLPEGVRVKELITSYRKRCYGDVGFAAVETASPLPLDDHEVLCVRLREEGGGLPVKTVEFRDACSRRVAVDLWEGLFSLQEECREVAYAFCEKHALVRELKNSILFIMDMMNDFAFECVWEVTVSKREVFLSSLLRQAFEQAGIGPEPVRGTKEKAKGVACFGEGRKAKGVAFVADEAGGYRALSRVEPMKRAKGYVVAFSFAGSTERLFALMTEGKGERFAGRLERLAKKNPI
ncbi:MAG: hypothetical protein OXF02_05850 [Simkaniaceae bacterium]|nr:hypothetical protein [Simkaniaceae bacterium]